MRVSIIKGAYLFEFKIIQLTKFLNIALRIVLYSLFVMILTLKLNIHLVNN